MFPSLLRSSYQTISSSLLKIGTCYRRIPQTRKCPFSRRKSRKQNRSSGCADRRDASRCMSFSSFHDYYLSVRISRSPSSPSPVHCFSLSPSLPLLIPFLPHPPFMASLPPVLASLTFLSLDVSPLPFLLSVFPLLVCPISFFPLYFYLPHFLVLSISNMTRSS